MLSDGDKLIYLIPYRLFHNPYSQVLHEALLIVCQTLIAEPLSVDHSKHEAFLQTRFLS